MSNQDKTDDVDEEMIKENQDFFNKANDWVNVDDNVIEGLVIIPDEPLN